MRTASRLHVSHASRLITLLGRKRRSVGRGTMTARKTSAAVTNMMTTPKKALKMNIATKKRRKE